MGLVHVLLILVLCSSGWSAAANDGVEIDLSVIGGSKNVPDVSSIFNPPPTSEKLLEKTHNPAPNIIFKRSKGLTPTAVSKEDLNPNPLVLTPPSAIRKPELLIPAQNLLPIPARKPVSPSAKLQSIVKSDALTNPLFEAPTVVENDVTAIQDSPKQTEPNVDVTISIPFPVRKPHYHRVVKPHVSTLEARTHRLQKRLPPVVVLSDSIDITRTPAKALKPHPVEKEELIEEIGSAPKVSRKTVFLADKNYEVENMAAADVLDSINSKAKQMQTASEKSTPFQNTIQSVPREDLQKRTVKDIFDNKEKKTATDFSDKLVSFVFAPGVERLADPAINLLAVKVLPELSVRPEARIQIHAFADSADGGRTSARRISLARALAVRAYLMDSGVNSRRIDIRALGDETERTPLDRVDIHFFY